MNKTKKNCIIGLVSLFVLMMTAASVSANEEDEPYLIEREKIDPDELVGDETGEIGSTEEEPNLISPSPENDEDPLIIASMDTIGIKDRSYVDNTTPAVFVAGIVGFVGLATTLIIIKKKY